MLDKEKLNEMLDNLDPGRELMKEVIGLAKKGLEVVNQRPAGDGSAWMDEARAAFIACGTLAQVEKCIAAWMETAAQHARNESYYRDLVIKIGEMFGIEAKTCDDGTVAPDVLCAKVPELVEKAVKGRDAWKARSECMQQAFFKENQQCHKLERWKEEAITEMDKWESVHAFIRNHPDAVMGDSIVDLALGWLKERDTFRRRVVEIDNERTQMTRDRDLWEKRANELKVEISNLSKDFHRYRDANNGTVVREAFKTAALETKLEEKHDRIVYLETELGRLRSEIQKVLTSGGGK